MKDVLMPGAGGTIARQVIDLLANNDDFQLTLFLRSNGNAPNARVVKGDVLNYDQLKATVAGQDIVYANLADDLEKMAENIGGPCTQPASSGPSSSAFTTHRSSPCSSPAAGRPMPSKARNSTKCAAAHLVWHRQRG